MINVTNLNGTSFVVNSNLIETIECIPETKITLTTGKYYLVAESSEDIIRKVISYNREIFKNTVKLKN